MTLDNAFTLKPGRIRASVLARSDPPLKNSRRVIVKARICRHRGGTLNAAKAHLRYMQRDGVTRDGEPGKLYDKTSNNADGKRFLDQASGQRHQFR